MLLTVALFATNARFPGDSGRAQEPYLEVQASPESLPSAGSIDRSFGGFDRYGIIQLSDVKDPYVDPPPHSQAVGRQTRRLRAG